MAARTRRTRSEFALIARLARRTRVARRDVLLGIGDDAALLAQRPGRMLVATADTLLEGAHFPRRTAAAAVGWKTLAVNLSDLAAMGAEPAFALLALTLPRADPAWLDGFARGWLALARRHGVALVGGDTTRGALGATVALLGHAPARRVMTRAGARPGDVLLVSGTLGDAAAGLALRQRRLGVVPPAPARRLLERLERPEPRVALGCALAGLAHAAIDVSDGLLQDLGHLLAASGVGAELDLAALPASSTLRRAVPDPARRLALQLGGDDYELCVALPERHLARAATAARAAGVALTPIGRVVGGRGIAFRGSLAPPSAALAWDPFARRRRR